MTTEMRITIEINRAFYYISLELGIKDGLKVLIINK